MPKHTAAPRAQPTRPEATHPETTRNRVSTGGTTSSDTTAYSTGTPVHGDTPPTSPTGPGSEDEDSAPRYQAKLRLAAVQQRLVRDIMSTPVGREYVQFS